LAQLTDDCFAFGGTLLRVAEAAATIRANIAPVPEVEAVPLLDADGRVLAEALVASMPLPPFDNAAVDGYAVRLADIDPGQPTEVRGRVAAGSPGVRLTPGSALRIFTGAPMPTGADTVFMQEDVTPDPAGPVSLPAGLARGANVRRAGEDLAAGALALPAGRRLRPQDLALAAALGQERLIVRRRLRVAVFSTGNEVTEAGRPLGPGRLYDSNRVLLAALVRRAGGVVSDLGILPDDRRVVAAALVQAASTHDLVLTSGGVSAGEEDHVRHAVEEVGRLVFWRLGIKPGRPVAMGVVNGTPFAGLPGNPVAAFVTFATVVRELMGALSGSLPDRLPGLPVTAGFDYRKKAGRREFVRVRLETGADGRPIAVKHEQDGAGILTSLTGTDGLADLPEDTRRVEPGDLVQFLPYQLLM
jgi:molybdopterin molybdotransferase